MAVTYEATGTSLRYTVTAKVGRKVVERLDTNDYVAACEAFDNWEVSHGSKATVTLNDNSPFFG